MDEKSNQIVINKSFVDGISVPGRYRDSKLTGFVLRVTPKGTKTYCVDTRVKGSRERVTYAIGVHGKDGLTAEQARKKADEIISKFVKQGLNPHEELRNKQELILQERKKKEAELKATTHTLSSVLEDYLKKKKLKPSSAYNYRCVINANMADWLDKPLIELTREMISNRHRKISDKSPGMADNTMRVLRALFMFAGYEYEELASHPAIAINPVRKLSQQKQWNRLPRRQTVIRKHQLKPWYEAVKTLDTQTTCRDYLLLLLFTGLRKGEAESLSWLNVDLRGRTFTIQETKNHEPLQLPMSDYIFGLLLSRWQTRESDEWVFPGRGARGHITDTERAMDKVIERSGVQFDLHDLRRTFATIADGLGIGSYTLKRLLNHKSSADVTAGYFAAEVERLREPMQEIADYILVEVGEKQPASTEKKNSKVTRLKRKTT
jgi:integrase